MDIEDYTTCDEIRSAVGMSSDELPDTELTNEMYANALDLAMLDITLPDSTDPGNGPLTTLFAVISALAEGSRTVKQRKVYALTRLFATYSVAFEVCRALSTRTPKMIADSKASITRFSSEATFRDTVKYIGSRLADLKNQLETLSVPSSVETSFMTVVSPAVDVITGE